MHTWFLISIVEPKPHDLRWVNETKQRLELPICIRCVHRERNIELCERLFRAPQSRSSTTPRVSAVGRRLSPTKVLRASALEKTDAQIKLLSGRVRSIIADPQTSRFSSELVWMCAASSQGISPIRVHLKPNISCPSLNKSIDLTSTERRYTSTLPSRE